MPDVRCPRTPADLDTLLPNAGGTYAILLRLGMSQRIVVGRHGTFTFPSSVYVYVGSAFGPGGLRARLRRQLCGTGVNHPHWHIDYFREHAAMMGVCYAVTPDSLECIWSQTLAHAPDARIPIIGFGSTDCHLGCLAHLIAYPPDFKLSHLRKSLGDPKWINFQSRQRRY